MNELLKPEEIQKIEKELILHKPIWDSDKGEWTKGEYYQYVEAGAKAQLAKSQEVCPECNGNGFATLHFSIVKDTVGICPTCQGTGKAKSKPDREGAIVKVLCEACFPYACENWDLPSKKRLKKCRQLRKWTDQIIVLWDEK